MNARTEADSVPHYHPAIERQTVAGIYYLYFPPTQMSKRNEKSKSFNATSDGEDFSMPQFTCCDCNDTLTDDLQGYHSLERCAACEAGLIEKGLSLSEREQSDTRPAEDIRIAWLEACSYDGFDGSLAEYREGDDGR